jgi:phage/plasmid-like protein (TIGR03299 family)
MPAEFTAGFSVREPMWHGLGTILEDFPGWDEAYVLAGHDFEVIENDVYLQAIGVDGDDIAEDFTLLDGYKAVTNDKTGTVFAVHNATYEVIQNPVGWDLAKLIVDQGSVKIETAGVLKDGAVCWALLRLDEPYRIKGDDSDIYPYVTVSWAHDGTAALRCYPTDVRVVCWNTHTAALEAAQRDDRAFTFRHTKNVAAKIEDAKAVMAGVRDNSAQFRELADELATIKVTNKVKEQFLGLFIPEPEGDVVSDRVRNNIDEARDSWRALFDGDTIPDAHRNTAYGLVEASVEYLDYLRAANSNATRFGRSLMRPSRLKARIVPMVRELVKAA